MNLFIPESVETLDDGWCTDTLNLSMVAISLSNKHFKYLDKSHQIIVGKSDPNKEILDTIAFCNRNIERVTILNYIKYIKLYAFENCKTLKRIEIPDDSEIESIGSGAFSHTSLTNFKFPKKIQIDRKYLFNSHDICYFEFLGDFFFDDDNKSFFLEFKKNILASFPNVKELNIQLSEFPVSLSNDFKLFVSAKVKISFLKGNDDDD